ncbi:MAG: hypothetical protein ACO1OQ_07715 [Rufibacter sp.]
MQLSLTVKNAIAFLAFLFVCHELHELIHTAVAFGQCGCWGERDFNVWQICQACPAAVNTIWATVAGPVLTYIFIWISFLLMRTGNKEEFQALGWALLFANKPFARIFTVLMRGGDESVITRSITGEPVLSITAWGLEVLVVLALTVPRLVLAWKLLHPSKRLLVFLSFLIGPMLVEFALMHKLGNALIQNGILAWEGILGSPVLVNLWNAFWLLLLFITFRYIPSLFIPAAKNINTTETRIGHDLVV